MSTEIIKFDKSNFDLSTELLSSSELTILEKINPIGALERSYARRLIYEQKIKELEVQLEQINKQAEIAHQTIEKKFQIEMERLKNRRVELITIFQAISSELSQNSRTRIDLMKMANTLQEQALQRNIPLDDKKMYLEYSLKLIEQVREFGVQGRITIETLIDSLPENKYLLEK